MRQTFFQFIELHSMEFFLDPSWQNKLADTLSQPYFDLLKKNLANAYSTEDIWPKQENIFNAFNLCPFDSVKVVILGQDPYPTAGHAHGLSFSVPSSVRPLPKSLKNIYKELVNDLAVDMPESGDLSHWASQGVLLLNTVLTVKAGAANSHKNIGWQTFTDQVIRVVSENLNGVIFILWGAPAQAKEGLIDTSKHHILKAPHPSPLSSYRGFFGSKPFSKTNELLALQGKNSINW
jgi:uracil-DNA glycosylase